jgi:sodium/potassium-transporting ATPase subunit alpha
VHRNATLGDNVLPKGKRTPRWLLYLKELLSPFALLLWVGAVLVLIAYLLQRYQGPSNLYLCIVLVIVIVLTATLSYYQNAKSDSLMEGFKKLIPHDCIVVRDGKKQQIEGRLLVPGDLVELKAG